VSDRLLRLDQVATRLAISAKQVGRLVEAGHLPKPKRIGSDPKFFESDITEYMFKLKHDLLPPLPKPERKRKPRKTDEPDTK
jgi:predicted DNA-binding transcriptional regulator AlpA